MEYDYFYTYWGDFDKYVPEKIAQFLSISSSVYHRCYYYLFMGKTQKYRKSCSVIAVSQERVYHIYFLLSPVVGN